MFFETWSFNEWWLQQWRSFVTVKNVFIKRFHLSFYINVEGMLLWCFRQSFIVSIRFGGVFIFVFTSGSQIHILDYCPEWLQVSKKFIYALQKKTNYEKLFFWIYSPVRIINIKAWQYLCYSFIAFFSILNIYTKSCSRRSWTLRLEWRHDYLYDDNIQDLGQTDINFRIKKYIKSAESVHFITSSWNRKFFGKTCT
jgi:hypothetical protein